MTNHDHSPTPLESVTMLGLGAMGSALAAALVAAGHRTTVWNRTAGKAGELITAGATEAGTVHEAVTASPLIVACLLDHQSVHEVLDPVATELEGRTLINLTTTTPNQARELAAWAPEHGIDYLDGGLMATPEMIGGPGSTVLYSGSNVVFEERRSTLDLWGASTYFGEDAGMASLYDLALLAAMYVMFAGFFQGAAMVGSEGVSASEFAQRAAPWLNAVTGALADFAEVIDGGDYTVDGQQSLEFSDLSYMIQAAEDQGVGTPMISAVQALMQRQIDAGHGTEAFARMYESIRRAA